MSAKSSTVFAARTGCCARRRQKHSVAIVCRVLGVSRSGFYAWVSGPICVRRHEDSDLASRICRIHDMSRGTYGAPKIHAELRADGVRVRPQARRATDGSGGRRGHPPQAIPHDDRS
jgi:hypothetical protein